MIRYTTDKEGRAKNIAVAVVLMAIAVATFTFVTIMFLGSQSSPVAYTGGGFLNSLYLTGLKYDALCIVVGLCVYYITLTGALHYMKNSCH